MGNLVEGPELRFTPNGIPGTRFTAASTPRSFDRDTDQWREAETTSLDCRGVSLCPSSRMWRRV
ncbi:single-stranded DNA-binding protein [Streptomyces erythrochromogenes]